MKKLKKDPFFLYYDFFFFKWAGECLIVDLFSQQLLVFTFVEEEKKNWL